MVCKLIEEFESRNISVVTIGNDTGNISHQISSIFLSFNWFLVSNYRKWIKDIEELQEVKVNIPLISDPECLLLRNV